MEFSILAFAHFLALLSPGPDFFLIMQASLRLPLRYGFCVSAGIAAANGVYLVCAVLGLETIKRMEGVMTILTWLGAGYLLFVGVMLLGTPRRSFESVNPSRFLHRKDLRHQFVIGFLSGILNPKNAIFYLSLFTVMVSVETPLLLRSLYALWMVTVVLAWDCLVAWLIGRETVRVRLGGSIFFVEKLAGVFLAFFGVMLPFV